MNDTAGQRLCRLDELPHDGSLRLELPDDPGGHGLCLIRRAGRSHAYLNRCAHMLAPMDWQPGQFLDRDGHYIVCALHGAHFRVEDGYCVAGPCKGARLTPVALREEGGYLMLGQIGSAAPQP